MATAGDLRLAAFAARMPSPPSACLRRDSSSASKVHLDRYRWSDNLPNSNSWLCSMKQTHGSHRVKPAVLPRSSISSSSVFLEFEGLLPNVISMNFWERLNLAWRILFPISGARKSDAGIAKQRLKMILFSDRCAVSDEAKQKIVENIVGALSEFVEIESREKVQLNVTTDVDLGTIYSVTVPVRRVKPDYQESEEQHRGKIVGIEYKDTGNISGTVDVTFDFFVPSEKR